MCAYKGILGSGKSCLFVGVCVGPVCVWVALLNMIVGVDESVRLAYAPAVRKMGACQPVSSPPPPPWPTFLHHNA